jgi:hypothetical protein
VVRWLVGAFRLYPALALATDRSRPCVLDGDERRNLSFGRLQEPIICWGVSASPWPGRLPTVPIGRSTARKGKLGNGANRLISRKPMHLSSGKYLCIVRVKLVLVSDELQSSVKSRPPFNYKIFEGTL